MPRRHSTIRGRSRTSLASIARVGLCSLSLLASLTAPATALSPAVEPPDGAPGAPMSIPGPDVSRAFFGYLSDDGYGDLYVFSVSQATTVSISVLVPAWPEDQGFEPELYVQAAGRRPIHVARPAVPGDPEFEFATLGSLCEGPTQEIHIAARTRYVIRVDPGEGTQTGRYVLVFGDSKDLSLDAADLDLISRLWFGRWGGARWYPNPIAIAGLTAAALLIIGLVVLAIRWIRSD